MNRIIIGLAEKVIIADVLGAQILLINNQILLGVDTPTMWLKSLLYFFQIYFDFSGYSQIAIGLCYIFGFKIKENFNYPYISQSITEFWRRWHISLGTWFREYVYIPLGGNRNGNVYFHLFIVFLLTGIWHGTNWTFLLWGITQGLFVIVERLLMDKNWYKKIPGIFKWAITILVILFSWILFSSSDVASAFDTYKMMFTFKADPNISINFTWKYFLSNRIIVVLCIAMLGSFIGFLDFKNLKNWFNESKPGFAIKQATLLCLFVVDIFFIVNSSFSPFLYFQF